MKKEKELFLQTLSNVFEKEKTPLSKKDIEFALFGFEMGLLANKDKNNGKNI